MLNNRPGSARSGGGPPWGGYGWIGDHALHETVFLRRLTQHGSDIRRRNHAAVRVAHNTVVAIAVVPKLFEMSNLRIREARRSVLMRSEAVVLVGSFPVTANCGFQ